MRRFSPLMPRRELLVRLLAGTALAVVAAFSTMQAQIPGRNVNMVSGTKWPDGDPFLQRQNEPSVAASTRNPLHLLGGSNDYRTVDVPGLPDGVETGDAWLGLFKSNDGGQRWTSTLLPGYPQDQSPAGLASPLKNYQAGADAVVRAGTSGLLYYSGLVFDRAENGKSGIFLARFIDNNNQEAGDPIAYLGTTMVAQSAGAQFLDKPWMAVDIPRNNSVMCTITENSIIPTAQNGRRRRHGYNRNERRNNGRGGGRGNGGATAPGTQRIPAGAVYVAYSSITHDAATLRSEILLTRSMDCGATWSEPIRVSRPEDQINQGASLTIDPGTGAVYAGWRRFDPDLTDTNDLDGIMVARLPFGAKKADAPGRAHKFDKPVRKVGRQLHRLFEHRENRFKDIKVDEATESLDQFDLGTTGFNFRTNAYPTMATDGTGRVYLAWTQRGFAADNSVVNGARIVIATTRDGRNFTPPQPVDDHVEPGRGHQLMPSMAFAGGKLMLVFYDLRNSKAETHNRISSDLNTNSGLRQTIDIRSAMAAPGDQPDFAPSVKVSDYLLGVDPVSGQVEELQVNPPNLPMFKLGTVPFFGDYIDVAAAPAFVRTRNGKWAYNTADTGVLPTFHAVWTDNRDVRPPRNGEWWNYTPAKMSPDQMPAPSIFDPLQQVPQCVAGLGNPGSRNQNVYSARITGGLLAGSPGNSKPLSPELQRAFVVFAQNTTTETRSFRMTILNQPVGGRASFVQFPLPPYTNISTPPETAIEMIVPPLSTASRSVYVTSSDPNAQLTVDISELIDLRTLATPSLYPSAPEKPAGLEALVVLNPDIENPDIENPDIENPDIENPDIENAEVYNPDIENPDIENPNVANPDIENPDIENPDIENPDIENPDIENVEVANPDIENPDIENPDIENPDIENPDIENPDIENGAIADVTWKVTNDGNTTAAFNVNLFLAQQNLPSGVRTQLVLMKTYRTPVTVANGCQLGFQTRNILLASIRNPIFTQPDSGAVPDQNDPAETNASLWLAPGEEGRITLRVIDDDTSNNLIITKDDGSTVSIDPAFAPTTSTTPTISSQGVGTEGLLNGDTDPPLVTPTGSNLFFLQMPTSTMEAAIITPTVRVQVRDLTGAPVAGAAVVLSFGVAVDALLSGNVAVAGSDGIASFPTLSVSTPGFGYTLRATATSGDVTATALSTPFNVTASTVVTNTASSGPGSLRAAMTYANSTPGAQTIMFAIPGATPAEPAVINLQTPLPVITEPVTIDGTSQPGYDGRPVVEVTNNGGGEIANGFETAFDTNSVTIRGLSITRFINAGISLLQADTAANGTGHTVSANIIGTDRAGTLEKGNGTGLIVRRDDAQISDNTISGNSGAGMVIHNDADDVVVVNNVIGLSPADNTVSRANAAGIRMMDSVNDVVLDSNIISGNAGLGIDIQNSEAGDVTGTMMIANRIGLNQLGNSVPNLGGGIRIDTAPGTQIGIAGDGNLIGGNANPGFTQGGPGITVVGSTAVPPTIRGNKIGTDPTGQLARPNRWEGIVLQGTAIVGGLSSANEGNLISGNGNIASGEGTGIAIMNGAEGSIVRGNTIGLAMGGGPLGNAYSGITGYGGVSSIIIGGDDADQINTISGNPAAGIALYTVDEGLRPTEIQIQGNSIFANGGLGIDLDNDGVTTNDAGDEDSGGANGGQNFPVLNSAFNGGPVTQVNVDVSSLAAGYTYRVRFFASTACDASNNGEGQRFVGLADIVQPGNTVPLSEVVPAGQYITATATDSDGNTSEFSSCVLVAAALTAWSASGTGVTNLTDSGLTGEPEMTYQANTPGTFTGAWQLTTVATETQNITMSYYWVGFHSFYQVRAGLEAFVNRDGTDISVVTLLNEGPADCGDCLPPSGGFSYRGLASLTVLPGDTYGFRLTGSHFDGSYALQGTFSARYGIPMQ